MKHRITTADVQAALDGLMQAGLIREFSNESPPQSSIDKTGLEFRAATRKGSRLRFGKRERVLVKHIIKEFCPRFAPGATVVYIADAESKFPNLEAAYLEDLGVVIAQSAKMPDVVVHDNTRNWLLLIEAVTSAGPVDGKRRKELKELFRGSNAGLVFVTAFTNRESFGRFQAQISWETEVWFAEEPDHILHYNGERFLGPYPDVLPS